VGEQTVCGCGVEMQSGQDPTECVLDIGRGDLCLYAEEIRRREECRWWREPEAAAVGSGWINERLQTSEHRSTRATGNDPTAGADPGGRHSTHPGRRDENEESEPAPEISQQVRSGGRNS
jgi:hypothetical protein